MSFVSEYIIKSKHKFRILDINENKVNKIINKDGEYYVFKFIAIYQPTLTIRININNINKNYYVYDSDDEYGENYEIIELNFNESYEKLFVLELWKNTENKFILSEFE